MDKQIFNESKFVYVPSDLLVSSNGSSSVRGRIFLSLSSQRETSVMRVRFQRPCKKMIIMCIQENKAYSLAAMDQDADSVWVMTLNCLGHNNAYSQ